MDYELISKRSASGISNIRLYKVADGYLIGGLSGDILGFQELRAWMHSDLRCAELCFETLISANRSFAILYGEDNIGVEEMVEHRRVTAAYWDEFRERNDNPRSSPAIDAMILGIVQREIKDEE